MLSGIQRHPVLTTSQPGSLERYRIPTVSWIAERHLALSKQRAQYEQRHRNWGREKGRARS
jgi:hypothetical protein